MVFAPTRSLLFSSLPVGHMSANSHHKSGLQHKRSHSMSLCTPLLHSATSRDTPVTRLHTSQHTEDPLESDAVGAGYSRGKHTCFEPSRRLAVLDANLAPFFTAAQTPQEHTLMPSFAYWFTKPAWQPIRQDLSGIVVDSHSPLAMRGAT